MLTCDFRFTGDMFTGITSYDSELKLDILVYYLFTAQDPTQMENAKCLRKI